MPEAAGRPPGMYATEGSRSQSRLTPRIQRDTRCCGPSAAAHAAPAIALIAPAHSVCGRAQHLCQPPGRESRWDWSYCAQVRRGL